MNLYLKNEKPLRCANDTEFFMEYSCLLCMYYEHCYYKFRFQNWDDWNVTIRFENILMYHVCKRFKPWSVP